MDKEEFIQKVYQIVLEKDGKESAEGLKKHLEYDLRNKTTINRDPQETADFWMM